MWEWEQKRALCVERIRALLLHSYENDILLKWIAPLNFVLLSKKVGIPKLKKRNKYTACVAWFVGWFGFVFCFLGIFCLFLFLVLKLGFDKPRIHELVDFKVFAIDLPQSSVVPDYEKQHYYLWWQKTGKCEQM